MQSWPYEHLNNRRDASVLVLQIPSPFLGWREVVEMEIVPVFNIRLYVVKEGTVQKELSEACCSLTCSQLQPSRDRARVQCPQGSSRGFSLCWSELGIGDVPAARFGANSFRSWSLVSSTIQQVSEGISCPVFLEMVSTDASTGWVNRSQLMYCFLVGAVQWLM